MQDGLVSLLGLGGPVVLILLALSVLALSVIIYKIWDLHNAGVGRHRAIDRAISAFDGGRTSEAREHLRSSPSHLAPLLIDALGGSARDKARLTAETENPAGTCGARLPPAGQHRARSRPCWDFSEPFWA